MHLKSFLAFACLAVAAPAFGQTNTAFDLDVGYIERTPRLAYDSSGTTGGWPAPGQAVQWVAHLHNWGSQKVASVDYRWILDGSVAATGSIRNWAAGTDITVSLPWNWEQSRHSLRFELDPAGTITGEFSRGNNAVTIDTDALAVGVWVEDGLSIYMHDNQKVYNDGANSFEDWLQRNITLWNKMFRDAVYPTSPYGIVDRVRLDHVVHVPNGVLPLGGGADPANCPDARDKTVDMMWGFPYKAADIGTGKLYDPIPGSAFQYQWGMLHEMNHARYLVDAYGFDVHDAAVKNITDGAGNLLMATPAMPRDTSCGYTHGDKYKGLMDLTHYFSEYEAYQWNRIAGRRARYGNYNAPGDLGVFLNADLPANNHFRFVDESLNPLGKARVELHQARGNAGEWYGKNYLDTPDATFILDADGCATLPRNPFGTTIQHTYGIANSVMLLVVKTSGGIVRTAFVESSDFNLEYWRGHVQDAFYEVQLNTASSNTIPGQILPGPRVRITGRVVDTTGAPVAGAAVGEHPDGSQYAVTDANGVWKMSVKVDEPLRLSAALSTAAASLFPCSQPLVWTPSASGQTLPDFVLPASIPNVLLTSPRASVTPTTHWLGAITNATYSERNSVDTSFTTRWGTSSIPATFVTGDSPLLFQVTLATPSVINNIVLHWRTSCPRGYRVEVSSDNVIFKTVYSTEQGTGGYKVPVGTSYRLVDTISIPAQTVHTIRIAITNLSPSVHYASLWEVQAGLDAPILTIADAAKTLRIAAGLEASSTADVSSLKAGNTSSAALVLTDAVRILRQIGGMAS